MDNLNTNEYNENNVEVIYKNTSRMTEIENLKKQREELLSQSINKELNSTYSPDFFKYCGMIDSVVERKGKDESIVVNFSFYIGKDGKERCRQVVENISDDGVERLLFDNDFLGDNDFKTNMLEASVYNFCRRGKVVFADITSEDNKEFNINIMTGNSNMLSIYHLSRTYIERIRKQALEITPDIYNRNKRQNLNRLSSDESVGGFVNSIAISLTIGLICGLGIFFKLFVLR